MARPNVGKTTYVSFVALIIAAFLLFACAPAAPTAPAKAPAAGAPTAAPASPGGASPTAAPKPAATAAPAAKIKRGGTARVHRITDWEHMDPHLSQISRPDALLVYDTLVDLQKDEKTGTFVPVPMLATSWDLSNPKSIVFKLRPGVKFHDGSDFNAEVAKWNLDRLRTHPKSFAKEYTDAHESVEIIDPQTIRLNLKYPYAPVLMNLTNAPDDKPMMVSKAQWDKEGDDGLAKKSVGTGPFSFAEWATGDHVTYKRFPDYWMKGDDGQSLPYLDQVIVRFIQDTSVAVVEMKAGNLDYMEEISAKDVPSIKSTPTLVYEEWPWQFSLYMFAFNAKPGAILAGDKMKPVRQAILQAVDKNALANTLGLGIGRPAYWHLGPGNIGYSEKVPKYDYNLDKAKQLMAQAGYPNGIDLNVDITARTEDIQNAQIYQQMLEKAGVRITITQQDRVAWGAKMRSGDWQMTTLRSNLRADPDQVLAFRFGSKGSGNYAAWSNADMDKCLQEGASEFDPAKRQTIYERCQGIVYDDAYYGFEWARVMTKARNKRLQGVPERWWEWYLTKAWLE
ncbi:MAG: ABC transporter substrate-binding protein [Bacteroidetes bacterium]|nr:ABC transporter substrate-binding protein [Bacteroidota bacterium]MCL5025180.1 ABC transporter substrate-binding protein [Chloroflexota bacterium]